MRSLICAALSACLLAGTATGARAAITLETKASPTKVTTTPQTAQPRATGPCRGWRYEAKRSTPYAAKVRRMRRLIRCVFTVVGIGGQVSTALLIAERESGFHPWARNPDVRSACRWTSPYGSCGLYQHLMRYWGGRVRAWLPKAYFPRWPRVGPLRARANVWVTAVMVRRSGWCPWTPPYTC
jgi:hypothetical protein